jgi:hypothetical protein
VTDPVADAARSAAAILALDFGQRLPADVEAALYARSSDRQRPDQYDPLAIAGFAVSAASLIVTAAQLAWSILVDRDQHTPEPSHDTLTRQIRVSLREQDLALPQGAERITDVVITEIIRNTGAPS